MQIPWVILNENIDKYRDLTSYWNGCLTFTCTYSGVQKSGTTSEYEGIGLTENLTFCIKELICSKSQIGIKFKQWTEIVNIE